MFEKATRNKLRFPFKGNCTIEDLWDLSLKDLDSIYKTLNAKLRTQQEDSLLEKKSSADTILELKINIIRHVVNIKLEERKAHEASRAKAEQRQKILSILEEKEDDVLRNKPIEELRKLCSQV